MLIHTHTRSCTLSFTGNANVSWHDCHFYNLKDPDIGGHTRRQAEVHKQTADLCVVQTPQQSSRAYLGQFLGEFIIRCLFWHIPHDFFIPLSRNSYGNHSSTPLPSAPLSWNRSPHISSLASPVCQRETDTLQTVAPAPSSFYKYTQRRHQLGALSFPPSSQT